MERSGSSRGEGPSAGPPDERPTFPLTLPPARRHPWAVVAVGIVLLVALAFWVTRSSIFALRTFHVHGNRHLTAAQVERLAGLSDSTNLLWLSTKGVVRRLETSPWVATVAVSRVLPSTLTVTIHERTAAAVVRAPGGALFLVAGDGMVLAPAAGASGLPALTGTLPGLRVGARIPGANGALAAVAALPPRLAGRVARAQDLAGVITLYLRSGVIVDFGSAVDLAEKGRVLSALLEWARSHGIVPVRIDVRAPTAPAILPEGAATPTVVPPSPSGGSSGGPSPSRSG